ncbi:putative inactive ATP-dependent zinc metalloprotease FTSHI 5, chloroplastic [Vitis vinifera]|uniref:Putative inactive ATP-dependent zinc metalloprotease FTSHI 5, chloroplastic n=1 Tax=Vitis vinifera TaxID=29760 RepID=A0A438IGU0_VITVI|nr:putative inactive ATP-dependent zinc metalloprotease FTSHI 5, chloroplastic [Vitis vinifera]
MVGVGKGLCRKKSPEKSSAVRVFNGDTVDRKALGDGEGGRKLLETLGAIYTKPLVGRVWKIVDLYIVGVLIVGERGTGKTSLALAIAAEAKVPVVEVKAQQLEAGLWVGQSASNVRELFQAARDLVVLYNLVNFCSFSIMKKFN